LAIWLSKPLPGGSIELKWNTISGATSYTIYRIERNENPFSPDGDGFRDKVHIYYFILVNMLQ